MRNRYILKSFCGALVVFMLGTSPARATGFPTFDIAEVINTIKSLSSQIQTQVSTIQETLAITNIQQAVGDKLGGISKFRDLKTKAEKLKERAEKAQRRAQKILELKRKYEARLNEAKNTVDDVRETYNNIKSGVENVVSEGEKAYNQASQQVNDLKNGAENVYNKVKGEVNDTMDALDNLNENKRTSQTSRTNTGTASTNVSKEVLDNLWEEEDVIVDKGAIKQRIEQEQVSEKFSYDTHVLMSYAEEVSTGLGSVGVKTGTDDEGNYYFPDMLSEWCGWNYTDTIDEIAVEACIDQICKDLNSPEGRDAEKFRKRYNILLGQAISSNLAASLRIKSKASSSKVNDEMEKVLEVSGDDGRTQISGNGEVSFADIDLNQDLLLVKSGELDLAAYMAIQTYCDGYSEQEAESIGEEE